MSNQSDPKDPQDPTQPSVISAQPTLKKKKSKAGRSLSNVNIDRLEKAAKTILQREINHLLDASHGKKLSKDDSASLRDYLKTIRELRKDEDAYLDGLTDEELTKEAYGTVDEE